MFYLLLLGFIYNYIFIKLVVKISGRKQESLIVVYGILQNIKSILFFFSKDIEKEQYTFFIINRTQNEENKHKMPPLRHAHDSGRISEMNKMKQIISE